MILFLIIFLNCFVNVYLANINWGYRILHDDHDIFLPNKWHKINPNCLGESQSPININFQQTEYYKNLTTLEISSNDLPNETWSVKNTGFTLLMESSNNYEFWTKTKELFKFQQLHFHWRGSEHYIDNKKFAGEMHMVFQSMNNTHMHSVVGFMLQMTNGNNPNLTPIIKQLRSVRMKGLSTSSTDFKLKNLIPMKIDKYYYYSGSLTTPSCDEVVRWILVDSPILEISEDQLLEFQSLLDANKLPILTNARPIQPFNDRLVKRSFTG